MGMPEELAGNYIGIALHHVKISSVETILEPVKSLAAVMSLINARWYMSENVYLSNEMKRNGSCIKCAMVATDESLSSLNTYGSSSSACFQKNGFKPGKLSTWIHIVIFCRGVVDFRIVIGVKRYQMQLQTCLFDNVVTS